MVTQGFKGDLAGRPLTNSAGDLLLRAATSRNLVIKLSDDAGVSQVYFKDSSDNTVASIDSNGLASFSAINGSLVYIAAPAAGSIAASKTTINSALDSLFMADSLQFYQVSADTANSSRTNFKTAGNTTFFAGKVLVFKNSVIQVPGTDFTENVNKYSVDFDVAPETGDEIAFMFIKS